MINKKIAVVYIITFTCIINIYSHCQIPCGIYDDLMRIHQMEEHVETIEKSMDVFELEIVDFEEIENLEDLDYLDPKGSHHSSCKNINMTKEQKRSIMMNMINLKKSAIDHKPEMKKGKIDLVISDLKMPGLSGEQLLKRIVATYPNIPVIILTGHGTIESAVEAMRYGAYDFLTKPVHLDRLELLVKRALSRRKLVLENLLLQEKLDEKNVKPDSNRSKNILLPGVLNMLEELNSQGIICNSLEIIGSSPELHWKYFFLAQLFIVIANY